MSVVDSLERELEALRARDPDLADSSLAAALRVMAEGLDGSGSLNAKALAMARYESGWATLRELAPPVPSKDRVDVIADGRRARRAGSAGQGGATVHHLRGGDGGD